MKRLGIGAAGKNVVLSIDVTALIEKLTHGKQWGYVRHAHKMSPRRARAYAVRLIKFADTAESLKDTP